MPGAWSVERLTLPGRVPVRSVMTALVYLIFSRLIVTDPIKTRISFLNHPDGWFSDRMGSNSLTRIWLKSRIQGQSDI